MNPVDSQQAEEAVVYYSARNLDIENCSLVLSAKNIGHRLRQEPDGTTTILVPAGLAAEARYQLDCFFTENKNWPLRDLAPPPAITAAPPTLMLMVALALFHRFTGPWQHDSIWFSQGAGDASAILYHGEWYRLLTALTLHADLTHLLSNFFIGGLLMHFFLQIHGFGLGLLAVLLSSCVGNYLNVVVHGGNHRFVGFSTAVFAMIGMLSVHQLVEQRRPLGIRTLLPLMGGVGLLAMLGSSGERTDIGAHLFGLLAGIAGGFILGLEPIRRMKHSSFLQTCLFFASVSILLITWNMALSPRTG